MTIKAVLVVITVILISLTTIVEAKQVIVGYSRNFDFATLEEYNISNYTVYQDINAFSANISDVTLVGDAHNKK